MKFLSENNSFERSTKKNVSLKLVQTAEDIELSQRANRALKIATDCKLYISAKNITNELREHIDALKAQDDKLTTLETIVMLLDYTEREFEAIKTLEKNKLSIVRRLKMFLNLFFKQKGQS